jgi:hypothetical protein
MPELLKTLAHGIRQELDILLLSYLYKQSF